MRTTVRPIIIVILAAVNCGRPSSNNNHQQQSSLLAATTKILKMVLDDNDTAIMSAHNNTWCAVCVCCGPDSVPSRSLPKYLIQRKGQDDTEVCASSDPIWVHCSNTECQLPPQKFECFMEFLDIINCSQYVPKKLFQSDLFLKNATPHYQRHCNGEPPSSDIYLPHCIGCSLSALINVGTKATCLSLTLGQCRNQY